MAALTITKTQVLPTLGHPVKQGTGDAAITPGQSVRFKPSTGKWGLAQCDNDTIDAGEFGYGIALTECGADGQPLVVALPDHTVTLGAGAAPAAGTVYFLGDTAGGLVPAADLANPDKAVPICFGVGSNKVKILSGAYDAGAVVP